jgi:hypothetical protein
MKIGRDDWGTNFTGTIDEVAVYGTALSAARVFSLDECLPAEQPARGCPVCPVCPGVVRPLCLDLAGLQVVQ